MQDFNNVILVARLVRDAELKYTNSGFAILNFSIATNRSIKKDDEWKDEVSFFQCTLFGKRAESLAEYMIKGKQIAISGSLKQDRWENSEGQKRSVVKIIVDKVQFIGSKKQEAVQAAPVTTPDPDPDIPPTTDDFDSDIPF